MKYFLAILILLFSCQSVFAAEKKHYSIPPLGITMKEAANTNFVKAYPPLRKDKYTTVSGVYETWDLGSGIQYYFLNGILIGVHSY